MKKVWETIKGYIWWTHPRGSFHYDVMVTLILLFIFVTPHFINYKDKPAERLPRPNSVLVMPDGDNGLIFRVDARDVKGATQDEKQADLHAGHRADQRLREDQALGSGAGHQGQSGGISCVGSAVRSGLLTGSEERVE